MQTSCCAIKLCGHSSESPSKQSDYGTSHCLLDWTLSSPSSSLATFLWVAMTDNYSPRTGQTQEQEETPSLALEKNNTSPRCFLLRATPTDIPRPQHVCATAMPKRFKRGKKHVRFSVGAEDSDGVVQEESEVLEVVEQGDEEEEGDSSGEEDEAEDIRQMVIQQNRKKKKSGGFQSMGELISCSYRLILLDVIVGGVSCMCLHE